MFRDRRCKTRIQNFDGEISWKERLKTEETGEKINHILKQQFGRM
jgi:hypothetical protein